MKNLLLLCILFFAFQNAIFAQNDFGITLGSGLHNQNFVSASNSKFTSHVKVGFSYQRNIMNERLQLSSSFNFHYFNGAKSLYNASTEQSIIGGGVLEDAALNSYNSYAFSNKSYFATSLPIILSINWKKFSLGGGMEFQYRTVNPNISLSYICNVQYQLSERFSINANFLRSLTNDNYFNLSQSKSRTQRIEASVRYRLLKK